MDVRWTYVTMQFVLSRDLFPAAQQLCQLAPAACKLTFYGLQVQVYKCFGKRAEHVSMYSEMSNYGQKLANGGL